MERHSQSRPPSFFAGTNLPAVNAADDARPPLQEPEGELRAAYEELQAANEELSLQQEEMATLNEELAAANEELRVQQEELLHVTEALREETHALETINRVGHALAGELDLQALLQVLTDAATEITGAEFGTFFYNTTDDRGEAYLLHTLSGVSRDAFAAFPMPRNTAIFAPTFHGDGVIRMDDVTKDERFGRNPPYHGMPEGHLPVRSYLAVPVTSRGGEVLGGLFFGHSQPAVFRDRHERMLVPIAAQAAVTIDNARLYQQARETARSHQEVEERLALLVEASGALRASLDPAEVLSEVLALSRRIIAADAYAVWRQDRESGSWRSIMDHGLPEDYPRVIPHSSPMTLSQPMTIEDVAAAPILSNRQEAYLREGIRSILVVPLHLYGEPSGTITFYYRRPRRFPEGEVRVAAALANLAASAIVTAELHQEQARLRAEAERAGRWSTFLAEASRILGSSLDYEATLEHVARLAVPELADWCTMRLLDEGGSPRRAVVAHADPEKVAWAQRLADRFPEDPDARSGVPHVLRTGETELYPEIPDELLVQGARSAEHLELLRSLGLTSAMIVALRHRNEVLGAITFISTRAGVRYGEREVEVAEDLARRAGTAIDNARLFRRSQEALAARTASEARLRRLVDANIVGVSFGNLEGFVLEANAEFLRILGLSEAEFRERGLRWDDLVPPDQRGAADDAARDLTATGVCAPYETELLRRDGSRVPVLVGAARLDAPAAGGVAFILDLTERRSLQVQAERLAAIVASSDDAIVSKDPDSIVRSWNKAAERIFGYTAEEMIGRSILTIIPPERHHEEPEILARIRRGERVEPFETQRVRKDGQLLDVSITISPIRDPSGRVIGASKIARDVTAQKALREELRRRVEELAEADRQKDEYLAMLAHELRNPLGTLSNAIQVLGQTPPDHPSFARALDVARRQVQQQRRMMDDLLDVSRLAGRRMHLQQEDLDLRRLVRQTVEDSREAVEEGGLALSLETEGPPAWVHGDPVRLSQVLVNLLMNALKFTDPGGEIRVRVEQGDGRVSVTVADTGIGIEPDLLPRLFEPFSQAEQSLARSRGGLGLGLALVKGIVELHGGEVRASSPGPGCGTSFTCTLPLVDSPPQPGSAAGSALTSAGRRVLIIEDLPDAAETLRDLLELAGHRVVVALSGPSGLARARTFRPEVVLCDIGLPGMDGYEVARRLRQQPENQDALLIALTGYGQEEDRRLSRAAGFDHHVVKPLDPADVQQLLAAGLPCPPD